MKNMFCPKRVLAMIAVFLVGPLPAAAEPVDPHTDLTDLINFQAREGDLDIAQATVSDCMLTLETLRRTEDRTIISTTTAVFLLSVDADRAWFNLQRENEREGAILFLPITDDKATATYRLDQPSTLSRRSFRRQFHQSCRGESCQSDFTPDRLGIELKASNAADRLNALETVRASITWCKTRIE
jgi:hypothetical protein